MDVMLLIHPRYQQPKEQQRKQRGPIDAPAEESQQGSLDQADDTQLGSERELHDIRQQPERTERNGQQDSGGGARRWPKPAEKVPTFWKIAVPLSVPVTARKPPWEASSLRESSSSSGLDS